MAKNTEQKGVLSMFNSLPEPKAENPAPKKETAQKPTKSASEKKVSEPVRERVPETVEEKRSAGGRPNTRGKLNVDSKRISLIVPTDLFDKIKANCYGNMTKFITDILREKLG